MPNTAELLEEIAALKAMLIAADARDLRKGERIERLEKLVAAFKHAAFGRRSEKSDLLPGNRLRANDERAEQFELALEDLETAIAAIHAEKDAIAYELGHHRLVNRDLQNERCRPPCMAGKHTYSHRQWTQTKPDRRSATMELRQQGEIGTPLTHGFLLRKTLPGKKCVPDQPD